MSSASRFLCNAFVKIVCNAAWTMGTILVTTGCSGGAFTAAPSDAAALGDASIDDATAADASDASDAAVDAGSTFCSAHTDVELCSDFDSLALPAPWGTLTQPGAATLAIDTSDSVSSPGSLAFTSPALDSGATASAFVSRSGLSKGVAHIELDLKIDKIAFPNVKDTQAGESVVVLTQGKTYSLLFTLHAADNAPYALSIVEVSGLLTAPTGTRVFNIEAASTPAVGTWSHWKIDATLNTANGSLTMKVDDHAPQTFTLSPPVGVLSGDRALTVGLTARGALGELKARVDNVTYSGK